MDNIGRVIAATVVVTLCSAAGLIILLSRKQSKKKREVILRLQTRQQLMDMEWECVGKVSKVFVYPIKSCRGAAVQSADAEHHGLVHRGTRDRCFMIVSESGAMVTGRQLPTMVLIQASLNNNILTLNHPDAEELQVDVCQAEKEGNMVKTTVWGQQVCGLDCGEEVSLWLHGVLKRKCKLLYHADLPSTRTTPDPPQIPVPLLRNDDHPLYADFTGFMLMTSESVADLQSRVTPKIAVEDFRPNIVVEGTRKAYDEDVWKYIRIGSAVFRNVKPCTRCIFTTVSAETGKKDPNKEPLQTLKRYRRPRGVTEPFFGINLGLDLPGTVSVGEEVFVTRGKALWNL